MAQVGKKVGVSKGKTKSAELIVISGLSGRFPESSNVEEFADNLFRGIDMITEDDRRWTPGFLGLPTRSGKLKELDKFDADYFSVHAKQADFMDPQLRMLLEVTHEAIIDAGVNPQEIRGQNIGVFIGASLSESERKWIENTDTTHGYALTGCERTMLSNRISFAFDFKGPSFTMDTACSSSLMALEQAFCALKLGHCDAAVVGGVQLCLDPKMAIQFHKLNMLSPQGKCQSFDADGDGYVRSEAVVAIFIQRKNVARRHYASILGVKTNTDGHKTEGVTFPSGQMQKVLLEATYKEAGVDPRDVVYVEAHGTGTPVGDPQELNAIADVFCRDRDPKKPLLIGSVKSNMGHAEPASGLCGMVKVLLGMQRGEIPGNLHYKTPNPKINALETGQLKVISENTKWNGGIVGINSFGFGGANVHAIFQSNHESPLKMDQQVSAEVSFIIPFSGRSKDSVELVLKEISKAKLDNRHLRLLHEIHSKNLPGHQFRGFAVVSENQAETEIFVQEIKTQSESPQVWFIFNGMGSQWAGMGKTLMKFQTCQESLQKSASVLKKNHLDLFDILINGKEEFFENVLNSFVSIAAIQIALVDLLTSLKIKPDGIIGHSVGELGAAYADGCLSAEQVILTAHARGQAILEMGPGDGAMAAVGLSWEEAKQKCPDGIYPACHNSKDSVTVSGPAKLLDNFVDQLTNEGIFARKVNSSNQAFHSKYIEPAKFKFKELLDKIIPVPVPRSSRWISSSIPESQWNSDLAKTSSADYHVNNLISPVLFQEALEKVPSSSVVIEIGPHCLLQAILKRSLLNCSHIGLLNKSHKGGSVFLCQSIGKMFNFGLNPTLSNLYPEVEFPVPVKTPSLSSDVSKCWHHSKSWNVPSFSSKHATALSSIQNVCGGLNFEISLDNEHDAFYSGHQIDGRIVFPQTGLIVLAWRAWAKIHHSNMDYETIPFAIENLIISRATIMPKKGESPLNFNVTMKKSTGEFWIEENGNLVASGSIRSPLDEDFISVEPVSVSEENTQEKVLSQQDFYKLLRLRGCEYSGIFQGIKRASLDLDWAEVEFSNWVAFLDALVHFLGSFNIQETKSLLLPTRLKKLVIDPQKFWEHLTPEQEHLKTRTSTIPIFHNSNSELLSCKGVQIQGQKLEAAPRNQQHISLPALEKFEFTPHFDDPKSNGSSKNTEDQCLQTCIGLVLENIPGDELNVLEISQNADQNISPSVKEFCDSQPKKTFDADILIISDSVAEEDRAKLLLNSGIRMINKDSSTEVSTLVKEIIPNRNLLIVYDLKNFKTVVQNDQVQSFVLLRTAKPSPKFQEEIRIFEDIDLTKVLHKATQEFNYCLFRKLYKQQSTIDQNIRSSNIFINAHKNSSDNPKTNYKWVDNLKAEMRKATADKIDQGFRINVISGSFDSEQFNPSGIQGLVNSLRREPGGGALRCFFINDSNTPDFDFENPDQELQRVIQRNLLMNVFQNGVWGSFRFFPLPSQTIQPVENAYLNFKKRGDLSSFQWFESPLKYSKENLCSVYYSALNFRDVMLASGKLNPGSLPNNLGNEDCVLGMEFSGLDSTGKRVMGIVPAKAMATSVVPDPGFLWQVPASWSLADAATVPVAYATAYYALIVRGRLKEGESVLIHGGAGAVGLASISIALGKNCNVFTTVGSQEKREFLKNNYPQLNDSSFANSRDTTFLQHIMNETNGRGVDVVLNSLAGDKLLASIECVAQHGRFLELGKVDLFNDTKLGMSIFLKDVNFSGILLDSLTRESRNKHKVWELVQHGIETGVVQPFKRVVFSDGVDEVENAFRFMASGKHIGKILIEIRKEENPHEKIIHGLPRTFFDPSKSYIILGGLGGFGLELCDWMIQRGATKLMLISRSGVTTGYQKFCLNRWENMSGVSVFVSSADATTNEGATEILKTAVAHFKGAPIGGIFNLAMVLRDGVLENQTPEHFDAVAKPKINSSMAMDKASRILAPELEYFVCFSSIVSGRGAPGLSNYAYANSALERICENRRSEGFPGLTIQWGAIGDVGVMVDKFNMKNDESTEGTAPQRIASCLNTLDIFLQSSENCSTLSSFVPASKSETEEKTLKTNWVELIARILGLDTAELEKNPHKPFSAFGMDSLMSAEMQQVIDATFEYTAKVSNLQNLSISKLREIVPISSQHKINSEAKNPGSQNVEDLKISSPSISQIEETSEAKVEKYNSDNLLTFSVPQTKLEPSVFSSLLVNLRYVVAYFFGMLTLSLVYFILSPISTALKQSVLVYIWLFQDHTRIKFVDGIAESLYIVDNVNVAQILKFSGQPSKEKITKLLQERILNFRTNVHFNPDSTCDASRTEEFYEPFERLKWSIEKGVFFFYWRKDHNFDLSRHLLFEVIDTCDLDAEMPQLAKHYHDLKWDSSQPRWEFRIVYSQKAQEFLMVLAWNHAYGDGPSSVRLFQQLLTEATSSVSKQIQSDAPSPSVASIINEYHHFSLLKELSRFLPKIRKTLHNSHRLIDIIADDLLKTWDTKNVTFVVKTEPHCKTAFGKFPLSKLRLVKGQEDGHRINLNAVILSICARVYARILRESRSGTEVDFSQELLPSVTWAPFQNSRSSLSNDAVLTPIKVPVSFDSKVKQGIFPGDEIKQMRETLKTTEQNLARAGNRENLLLIKGFLEKFAVLSDPFFRLLSNSGFRSSFFYANVLAIVPKTEAALALGQDCKFMDSYGFSPPAPLSLILITDSVNDSLKITLTVSKTLSNNISPDFHRLFFPYFEQEMNHL